jgi:hypothetical protein
VLLSPHAGTNTSITPTSARTVSFAFSFTNP